MKIKEVAKDARPRTTGKKSVNTSPALSMENLKGNSIKGRMVAILIDEGFSYKSVTEVMRMLKKNGAMAHIISKFHGKLTSSTGETLETDKTHITTSSVLYDALFIPGGEKSIAEMRKQGAVIHFINETFKHCKTLGLTGEAIDLLAESSIKDINAAGETSEKTVADMGVVTATRLNDYAEQFKMAMIKNRHWEREMKSTSIPA
jgi:catalase